MIGEGERRSTMFEKLNSPQELFSYQLGAALKMENTVLKMLGDLEEHSQSAQLKQQLRQHADETREQIRKIEHAFSALSQQPDENSCPAIEGIEKEGKANIKKADESVVDAVIVSGAAETEHHEIAVYEGLITEADSMGKQDIIRLLRENLAQEEHTLREINQAAQQLASQQFAHAA
jgi:ferritin-like metal-binding protein YciE